MIPAFALRKWRRLDRAAAEEAVVQARNRLYALWLREYEEPAADPDNEPEPQENDCES